MQRKWTVSRTNKEYLEYISRKLSISPVLAQILVSRGIKDETAIRDFLNPLLNSMHDPLLLPDMDRAVARLIKAMENEERVFVHGDYDADGVTATALVVTAFEMLGLRTDFYVPDRMTDGYGVSMTGLHKAVSFGASVLVTVDCGVSDTDVIYSANKEGLDVIVTDHHKPPESLPPALAVIDPHRADSRYPFKRLAGVGVAFKLVHALVEESRRKDIDIAELLDLVALGTIADSVSLTGENRVFAYFGLQSINKASARTGIMALKKVSGVNGGSRRGPVSFSLIPRINAAGRLDNAAEAVKLLLAHDTGLAAGIAGFLDQQNARRRKIESDVLREALEMIGPSGPDSAIVLSSPEWHPGVIGIVASRLVEKFYRPVFLFSVEGDIARGSARGIPPLDLYGCIEKCSALLKAFGGHRQAAGLKLQYSDMSRFEERINSVVQESLSGNDIVPVLNIDAAVRFSDLKFDLVGELESLEPFGESNRQPVLGTRDVEIISRGIVGNNHLKMKLRHQSSYLDAIGFGMGDELKNIPDSSPVDIAFVPSVNEWNGTKRLQLQLKGLRPSGISS